MTPTLLPWGLLTDRIGERVVLPLGLSTSAIALGCRRDRFGLRTARAPARGGRRTRRQRQRRERPGGDALVRPVRARPGTRDPPGERPSRRTCRRADPATARRQRRARLGLRRARRHLPRGRPRRRRAPPRAGGRTCSRSPRTCPLAAASGPGALADLLGQCADRGGSDRDDELHRALPQRRTGILDQGRSSRLRRSPGTRRGPADPAGSRLRSVRESDRASLPGGTRGVGDAGTGRGLRRLAELGPRPRARSWRAGSACRGTGCRSSPPPRSRAPGRVAPRSGSSRRSSESPGSSRRSASRPSSRQGRGGSRSSSRPSSRWPAGP